MRDITIMSPIWATRSIGIAEYKIVDDLRICISYETKDNGRLYPDAFYIKKKDALKYPVQYVKNVKLHIIPIDDLLTS